MLGLIFLKGKKKKTPGAVRHPHGGYSLHPCPAHPVFPAWGADSRNFPQAPAPEGQPAQNVPEPGSVYTAPRTYLLPAPFMAGAGVDAVSAPRSVSTGSVSSTVRTSSGSSAPGGGSSPIQVISRSGGKDPARCIRTRGTRGNSRRRSENLPSEAGALRGGRVYTAPGRVYTGSCIPGVGGRRGEDGMRTPPPSSPPPRLTLPVRLAVAIFFSSLPRQGMLFLTLRLEGDMTASPSNTSDDCLKTMQFFASSFLIPRG